MLRAIPTLHAPTYLDSRCMVRCGTQRRFSLGSFMRLLTAGRELDVTSGGLADGKGHRDGCSSLIDVKHFKRKVSLRGCTNQQSNAQVVQNLARAWVRKSRGPHTIR